ncbi:MAG: glycosyltransferase [Sphingobacteriaceae bacterium]|nr:MAG: glycosyltransferase [Sphingobacteriaceae bacterium]
MHSQISVILATYNGERFIKAQLDSILSQNLKPAEIIVSDDHSTDNTVGLLQKYMADKLLCMHSNSDEPGVISNFKSAAKSVTPGNYIAFADQDDIWNQDKLAVSYQYLSSIEQPGLPCVVYSDPEVINEAGECIHASLWDILGYSNYAHTLETVLFGNPAGGLTMLINPELSNYISTIPNNGYMHDAWLTLCAYTFGCAAIAPGPLVKYRQHANNVTFSTNYKQVSRMGRIGKEVLNALKGKSDLFEEQILFVKQFYACFKEQIPTEKARLFEAFIGLQGSSYLKKKIAFRKAMKIAQRVKEQPGSN